MHQRQRGGGGLAGAFVSLFGALIGNAGGIIRHGSRGVSAAVLTSAHNGRSLESTECVGTGCDEKIGPSRAPSAAGGSGSFMYADFANYLIPGALIVGGFSGRP
jgi:hypothetical protein